MTHTVVHFIDAEIFGGSEEMALMLLSGFDRRRWRPVLFHYDAPGLARVVAMAERLGVRSRVVPAIDSRNLLTALPAFMAALRQEAPAVFHVHLNWPLACRHAVIAARLSRVPVIVGTSHLCSPLEGVRFSALKQRIQAASLHRYLAVSDEVKERLRNDLGVPQDKIEVVRNGIRTEAPVSPTDPTLRAAITGSATIPFVLTPARLHRQKGHTYLLDAAALVTDACFVFAGDGPERSALETQARRLGIESRVRFLGQRNDIASLLAVCDLFVLPSLYEGLPISVLEAMAAGRPVVATRIGGTTEAVLDGVTGALVPPANPQALAETIGRLLADPALAARMAVAGQERARTEFSSEAMVAKVSRAYENLLSSEGL